MCVEAAVSDNKAARVVCNVGIDDARAHLYINVKTAFKVSS
jgi:hypothetical protein